MTGPPATSCGAGFCKMNNGVREYAHVRSLLHDMREDSLKSVTDSGRTSTHSPAAVYGFVLWLLSFFALAAYVAWAFDLVNWPALSAALPSRYWAVALPAWMCVTLALVPLVYRLMCIAAVPMPPFRPRQHVPSFAPGERVPPLTVVE